MLKKIPIPYIIAASAFLILIILSTVSKPYFDRRQSTNILVHILELWQEGNHVEAIQYWNEYEESPPVNYIDSYKIVDKEYTKKGSHYAGRFIVRLYFEDNLVLPSGRQWEFVIEKTKFGWFVTRFKMIPE
ncbi:MAG: hypothetical protein KC713_02415 [Candidatus Omnitrophica bacterium]|nr:hypothetical protein [Candidatus Omnitrophota bacterium]